MVDKIKHLNEKLNEIKGKYNIRESEISLSKVLHPKEVENIGLDKVLDKKYHGYTFNFGMKKEGDAIFNKEELFIGKDSKSALRPNEYIILLSDISSNDPSIGANIQYVLNSAILFKKVDGKNGPEICIELHNNSYTNNFAFRKTLFDTTFYDGLEVCIPLGKNNNIRVVEREIDNLENKIERTASLEDNRYSSKLKWLDMEKVKENIKELKRLSEEIDRTLFREGDRVNLLKLEKILEKAYKSLVEISREPEYFKNMQYVLDKIKQLNYSVREIYEAQKREKPNEKIGNTLERSKELKEKTEETIRKIKDFLENNEDLFWFLIAFLSSLSSLNDGSSNDSYPEVK